jgi:hypothetical protein
MSGGNLPTLGRFSTDFSKGWKTSCSFRLISRRALQSAFSEAFWRTLLLRGKTCLVLCSFLAASASAENLNPVLGTNEEAHLKAALQCMKMTETDLGFQKDHGKPQIVLQRVRDLLAAPLGLPTMADDILATVLPNCPPAVWLETAKLLEVKMPDASTESGTNGLSTFLVEAHRAEQLLSKALGTLTDGERRYVAAALFAGTFNAEDKPGVRADLLSVGISSQEIDRAISEGLEIDPEPSSTNFLAVLRRVDFAALLEGGRVFQQAVYELRDSTKGMEWPSTPTRAGGVLIGTTGDDVYTNAELLILDPGGDDTYSGDAGSANGLLGRGLAAIVDLGGDDRYVGDRVVGPGAALFGAAVLLDCEGDDLYRAKYIGQASAFFGVGWLEDRAGDDVYRAQAHSQAAGYAGFACLRDDAGNDLYDVGFSGQAYAGVMGVGLLVDEKGNDRYLAGGVEHDYERNDDRYISLAQGFAIGMRPYAGGGVAALVDLAGNDSYVADVFAQGVSYWYSVGMLLDVAGDDTYTVYQYGQGSGIHLSLGLLADGGGKDLYTGYILTQGNAHDYGVGMMFEQGGDDTYTADHHSQGRALNNALAILVDSAGDDGYFGRQSDQCQGVGNDAGEREYGSLAVLMDLAGKDVYSCGATNGCRMLRPDFGIIYDDQP